MLVKTQGIVFRTQKFRDNSLITDIYTASFGLRSYLVNGVYSKKGHTKIALLQPLQILDLLVYEKEHQSLSRISEMHLAYVPVAAFDMRRSAVALFMAEVARNAIHERTANEDLYIYLADSIRDLDRPGAVAASTPLIFLCRLSVLLGFGPDRLMYRDGYCFDLREGIFCALPPIHSDSLDPEQTVILKELLTKEGKDAHEILCTKVQRQQLLHCLLHYFHLHIELFRPLRSTEVIGKVLQAG